MSTKSTIYYDEDGDKWHLFHEMIDGSVGLEFPVLAQSELDRIDIPRKIWDAMLTAAIADKAERNG